MTHAIPDDDNNYNNRTQYYRSQIVQQEVEQIVSVVYQKARANQRTRAEAPENQGARAQEQANREARAQRQLQQQIDNLIQKQIAELRDHLNKITSFVDEKHSQKRNVLAVAIDVLEGKKPVAALEESKKQNPLYNKAFFESATDKLVFQVQSFTGDSQNQSVIAAKAGTVPPNAQSETKAQLIKQIDAQLNKLEGKTDEKHSQKREVLQMSKKVLEGKATLEDLEKVKKDNPRYKEAFFGSKTEHLVSQSMKLATAKNELNVQLNQARKNEPKAPEDTSTMRLR